MTGTLDTTSRALSALRLARIADVKPGRRRDWAARDLLREAPGRTGRYGELDAAELVILDALVATLGYDDAVLAWEGIRPEVPGALKRKRILALVDDQSKSGHLVVSVREVGGQLVDRHPFRLIDLTADVNAVRRTYRRIRDIRR